MTYMEPCAFLKNWLKNHVFWHKLVYFLDINVESVPACFTSRTRRMTLSILETSLPRQRSHDTFPSSISAKTDVLWRVLALQFYSAQVEIDISQNLCVVVTIQTTTSQTHKSQTMQRHIHSWLAHVRFFQLTKRFSQMLTHISMIHNVNP